MTSIITTMCKQITKQDKRKTNQKLIMKIPCVKKAIMFLTTTIDIAVWMHYMDSN